MSSWLTEEEIKLFKKVLDIPEIIPKNRKGGLKLRNLSFYTTDTKAVKSLVDNLWQINNDIELSHNQYYNALKFSGLIDEEKSIDIFGKLLLERLEQEPEMLNLIRLTEDLSQDDKLKRNKYIFQIELIIFLAVNYKYHFNSELKLTSFEIIDNLNYFKTNIMDTLNEPSGKSTELSKILDFDNDNDDNIFLILQGINFQGFEVKKLLHLQEEMNDFIELYLDKYDSIKSATPITDDERDIHSLILYFSKTYQRDIRYRAKAGILSSILYEYIIQDNSIYKEVFSNQNVSDLVRELGIDYIVEFYRELVGIETNSVKLNYPLKYHSDLQLDFPKNLIIFGAPGTGKSYELEDRKNKLLSNGGEFERVTFHPEYSYGSFVGTYKPVPDKNSEGKDTISYKYVPGPFIRVFVKAIKNLNNEEEETKPFLLVIEEINRANIAGVFGDIFQLLDRKNGVSEYSIHTSEDMKKYLVEKLGGVSNHYNELRIPDNMFIWATMNSADQGVFPMDTAFKRRWSFEYIDINANEDKIRDLYVSLGNDDTEIEWNQLRKAINNYLIEEKVNEDKLIGPFFINVLDMKEDTSTLDSGKPSINKEKFNNVFKNKILMYLFEDAARHRRDIFNGVGVYKNQLSVIGDKFIENGIDIFDSRITNKLIRTSDDDI